MPYLQVPDLQSDFRLHTTDSQDVETCENIQVVGTFAQYSQHCISRATQSPFPYKAYSTRRPRRAELHAMPRALNARLACQAMALKVSANLVVQFVRRWNAPDHESSMDWQQVIEFAFYGALGSQIGNVVQFVLEDWFPTGNASQTGGDVLPDIMSNPKALDEKGNDEALVPGGGTTTGWRWRRRRKCLNISPDIIWRNILAKLLLDQTIGLLISGSTFLICTNIARVPHPLLVLAVVRARLWPLIKAGWHIWPLVAICNFLWVPLRSRVLVAVCVGFGWSIFLSIFAMRT